MAKFKRLNLSDDWKAYLIRYPRGYTILENLIDWLSQTNKLIDNVNDWNAYLDDFVENFDKRLEPHAIETLYKMAEDGTLDRIINENIFGDLNQRIEDVSSELTTTKNELFDELESSRTELFEELGKKTNNFFESATFIIPRDFPDIQTAINELSELKFKEGTLIDLVLQAGYYISKPIHLKNGDYSHFRISSELTEVFLSSDFPKTILLRLDNCRGPIINTIINCQGRNTHGIYVDSGSIIYINEGCGVTHSGTTNLYVRGGGVAHAEGAILTHGSRDGGGDATGGSGITAWGGHVFADGADVSNSNTYGAQAAHGGVLAFRNGKANNCGRHGIRATNGALVDARSSEANNAGVHGYYALAGGQLNAYGGSALNAGSNGIFSSNGSSVNAREVDVSGSNIGVNATAHSTVNFYLGIANNCVDTGILANSVSVVNGYGANVNRAGKTGVSANNLSYISLEGAVVQNSGVIDLEVLQGSQISANRTRTTNSETLNPKIGDTNVDAFDTFSSNGCIWW